MNRLDRDGLPACGQIDKTLSKIDHQRAARCERPQRRYLAADHGFCEGPLSTPFLTPGCGSSAPLPLGESGASLVKGGSERRRALLGCP
jgi:hypothetical protein